MALKMETFSKICLVGPEQVGKTSLLRRAWHDLFSREYKKTIGVDFGLITKKIDSTTHKLQFWDIAGAEQPRMLSVYLRESDQIIICFDASATADVAYEQVKEAIAKIKASGTLLPHDIPITLMGCKNDLRSEPFKCSRILELAQAEFPNARSISMFLSSAKTGTAIMPIPYDSQLQTITFDEMLSYLAKTSVAPKPAADTGASSQTTSSSTEHHDPDNTEDSSGLGRLLCCFWSSSNNRTTEQSSLLGANTPSTRPTAGRG